MFAFIISRHGARVHGVMIKVVVVIVWVMLGLLGLTVAIAVWACGVRFDNRQE